MYRKKWKAIKDLTGTLFLWIIYEKSIKIRRRRFGETHEQTLIAMLALAEARIKSGKPHYAEPLYKKVIEARSKDLGAKNPKVIDVKAKLVVQFPLLQGVVESTSCRDGVECGGVMFFRIGDQDRIQGGEILQVFGLLPVVVGVGR